MGAKLQKIIKTLNLCEWEEEQVLLAQEFIIGQTYLNATKAEYLRHCFRLKVLVLSCKEISPC